MASRGDIIKRVKVKLEELSPFDEPSNFLAIPDNSVKPIQNYIDDTLDKSFDDVLLSVPLHFIREAITNYSPEIIIDNEGVGTCAVPENFLRLHTVSFPEWRRDVKAYITPAVNSSAYNLQRNRYTRGKFEKPVIAINNGKFEIYTLKKEPILGQYTFRYIPITENGTLLFEDGLSEYLVIQNAIHILQIFEQNDKAKILSEELSNKIKVISV